MTNYPNAQLNDLYMIGITHIVCDLNWMNRYMRLSLTSEKYHTIKYYTLEWSYIILWWRNRESISVPCSVSLIISPLSIFLNTMNYKEQKRISVMLWSTNYISLLPWSKLLLSQEPKYPPGTGKWQKWVRALENKCIHTPAKGGCNHSPLWGYVRSWTSIITWSIVQGMLKYNLCKNLLIHKYWHHVWLLKHYENETQYIKTRFKISGFNFWFKCDFFFFFKAFLFISLFGEYVYNIVSICCTAANPPYVYIWPLLFSFLPI